MGEWADHYIDRQIDRHLNPFRGVPRHDPMDVFKVMNDKTLIETVKTWVNEDQGNPSFAEKAKGIISGSPRSLSEKQRNVLLGFLNYPYDSMAKYKKMGDEMLMRTARDALEANDINEGFKGTATNILSTSPLSLSEKQRKCLLGLLRR